MDGQVATTGNSSTAVAVHGADPFSSYGARVGQTGLFLTFKNGEFLAGQNAEEIAIGTRLAANVAGLRIGWKRWFGGQVTDDLLVPLVEQQPLQPRNTLGDLDQQLWERDEKTKVPRDPWQLTNELIMVDAEGQEYIYATASKGGIGAIGRLCKEYGKLYRQKPGMVPIIALGNDHYMHKEFGKTYVPEFQIVDWADETSLQAIESEAAPAIEPPKPVPATAKKARF
jgi:hypothetical protein